MNTRTIKNRIHYFLGVLVICVGLAGCSKDSAPNPDPIPAGGFTMINGFWDADALIYYADRRAIQNSYFPLYYRTSDFVNLFAGSRSIQVTDIYSPVTLIDTSFAVTDSTYYSSFIFGSRATPRHFITVDLESSVQRTTANSSGVRFFNLADTDKMVSLQIGDDPVKDEFTDRVTDDQASATDHQGFLVQTSGTYTLKAIDENDQVLATRENIILEANSYYTIILIGKEGDANTPLYIGVLKQYID